MDGTFVNVDYKAETPISDVYSKPKLPAYVTIAK